MINKLELQQLVKKHIKSESDLSRQIGVSRQAVNKWLNTDRVTYDKLFELIEFVGFDITLNTSLKENN